MSHTPMGQALAHDQRLHDAFTDLYAYALVLDAEWQRSQLAELGDEVDALRSALAALRNVPVPTDSGGS